MLDSIQVENYRAFKKLDIKNLGRINLIGGRNDTGKTRRGSGHPPPHLLFPTLARPPVSDRGTEVPQADWNGAVQEERNKPPQAASGGFFLATGGGFFRSVLDGPLRVGWRDRSDEPWPATSGRWRTIHSPDARAASG
jgi:hypothetical protein